MKKTLLFLIILLSINGYNQQLAFPCAKGAGAYATGGRGGQVIHVTTLNWTGPGSLKEAIQTPGKRTIVFDVSGEIDATSEPAFSVIISGSTYDSLTIAGQTAPNGGITVKTSYLMFEDVDNVIVRYVRFRNEGIVITVGTSQYLPDSFKYLGGTNIIFDHCTFSHGVDQTASWANSTGSMGDVTIQNCFFQDSKTGSILGVDEVGGDFTFINNAYSNISHRFPNPKGNGQYDIINNMVYNWRTRLVRITHEGTYNIMNNYYKPSAGGLRDNSWYGNGVIPATALQKLQAKVGKTPLIYTSGNVITGQRETPQNDDSDMWVYFTASDAPYPVNTPVGSQFFTGTQFPLVGEQFTIKTAHQAYTDILNNVGSNATLNGDGSINFYRDSKDAADILMIQNDTYAGSFYDPISSIPHPTVPTNTRPAGYDTDLDGMPDVWENATFGNLSRDGTLDFDADGYTDLEEFLNLVDSVCNVGSIVIPVTGVTLSPQIDTINIPTTLQIVKTITPANATDQTGVWMSSNTSIATVNASGLVTPLSAGDVTIYFTTNDSSFTDSSLITVTNNIIPVTGVSVSPSSGTISISQTLQLTETITPSNATDQTGFWTSSNSSIASVSASGIVTGVALGTATITFTTNDGGYTATSVITVVSNPELYVESSAASIPNETNSIGSWTYDHTPVVSTESQTGAYSIAYTTANDYEEIRYEGLVLNNGVNYELKLLIKGDDNSVYSYIRGGVSSYNNGINTSFVVRSSHYGASDSAWQMHTWQLVGDGTPLKVALGFGGINSSSTFYLDEMSVKELNTTNIENIKSKEDIVVYPNPTNGEITIKSESVMTKVEVYNSLGALVLTKQSMNTKITNLDLFKLPKGAYSIKVYEPNKVVEKQLIKN